MQGNYTIRVSWRMHGAKNADDAPLSWEQWCQDLSLDSIRQPKAKPAAQLMVMMMFLSVRKMSIEFRLAV